MIVAGLDVAVAGFGAGWLDAQHHHVVGGGGHGNALLHRLRKRGSSAMTWSEGKMPSTASGFWRSMRKAARPQAGAVLRKTGSAIHAEPGAPGTVDDCS